MVRKLKIFALAGALVMATSVVTPSFAQDPLGDITKSLGDLDPTHILSPAPAAAPAAAPVAKKRHMARKRMAKKKMMGKKMMMKKSAMKKPMMKKKMMMKKK